MKSGHYCQRMSVTHIGINFIRCCWRHCDMIGITGASAGPVLHKKWRPLCFDTESAGSEVPFFLNSRDCEVLSPIYVAPKSHFKPWYKMSRRLEFLGRVLFFLFQMLLIFKTLLTKPHPQVLHIWWVNNDGFHSIFLPSNPHVCAFWYIFFFCYFFVRFAVSRDFDWEIGDLTNVQKTHRYLTIF